MEKKDLNRFIGKQTMSIVDAMRQIDSNARGIIFIVDDDEHLCASVTDGDIRRWILNTGDMRGSVSDVMNRKVCSLPCAGMDKALDIIKDKRYDALPIVDDDRHIVDIIVDGDARYNYSERKLNIPVIIMAGGKGTRLYPVTKVLPKPLIPIGDIPIIERIMNRFYACGIEEFYLSVNYKKEMIKSYFNELELPYSLNYIEETQPLGTAGSIRLLNMEFETPIIVTNCDILIDIDYSELLHHHSDNGNDITIVSALKHDTIPYGVIKFQDGLVSMVEEKPERSYYINTGMYLIDPKFIEMIPEDKTYHMTDLVGAMINKGCRVGFFPIQEEAFLDMGQFEELRIMEERLSMM